MGDSGAEVVLPLGRDALFSMLDPDGGWRVAQRRLREAMRPVAMATRFDAERSRLRLWVSTRRAEGLRAWTHWRVVRTDGMLLDEGGEPVTLEGCGRAEVGSVELSGLLREYSPVEVLVWTSLETEEGGVLWQGCTPLCETKHLQLADPSLSVEVEAVPARSAKGSPEWRHDFRVLFPEHDDEDETRRGGGHWFRITLTALAPTLWVELSTPGLSGIHFGENTFCLETESPKEILVRSARVLTLKAFRSALRVGNLFDLMTEDRS